MRQRIDLAGIYQRCLKQAALLAFDGKAPQPWPQDCPFAFDDLLAGQPADLKVVLKIAEP